LLGIAPGNAPITCEPVLPMNRPARITANTITGTLEAGARGPILRDADGVAWRLHFGEEPVPDRLDGKVSVRGKIVQPDRIDVEFWTPLAGE
jgi:hypothetical protein